MPKYYSYKICGIISIIRNIAYSKPCMPMQVIPN